MSHGLSSEQTAIIVTTLSPFDCEVIYLFGSRASGNLHPESDLDVAFLPGRPIAPMECFTIANRLSDKLGTQVDVVDLSTASTVLAKEVVAKGVALSVRDPLACQNFEMRTLSDYARLNEERREILAG